MSFTLVAFHAHPDDESLLTGGTLARAAAEGHRVVLVTATAGEAGLADDASTRSGLGERRLAELDRAAAALGCARVVLLGYPDSGSDTPTSSPGGPVPFALLDPAGPAARLAAVLDEERADVLTVYDEHGGYGHADHVQVHRVGVLAAELAGTPVVLEATVDRDLLGRIARLMEVIPGLARLVPPGRFANCYTARSDLTHRVDVRRHLGAKRAALAAHHSQTGGGRSIRTVALLLRLPRPLLGPVLGHEWFRERGRPRAGALLDDVFETLR
ncbi:PIG-L deacetylase family protein [Nocardioides terrisoli]|uniref:PIG-L deacetylase family protein n=1 Tax=Nocardioides terrisoli TaxID=3388267 RepID=UPI00287B94A5|nr:PIG-L family deacetylase [Nocardioides marmorisolisilvae]